MEEQALVINVESKGLVFIEGPHNPISSETIIHFFAGRMIFP